MSERSSGQGQGQRIRLAYFVREPFPTYRVDLDVLFARELSKRGLQVDFVMQAEGRAPVGGEARWHGCRVLVGPTNTGTRFHQRLHKHWLALRHQLRWLARISSRSHNAIQVRDEILIAALAAPVARLRGLKFFFWLSFPISEGQVLRAREGTARYPFTAWLRGSVSQWVLYHWIMPLSAHVFVQSEQMKRDVITRGIPASKLTAVPMGIASADVRRPRTEVADADPAAQSVIGYLGTLSGQRRLDVLLDALALIRKDGVDARLLLIGDSEDADDRRSLQRRADELGLREFVEITGFLPRAEALERIAAVDIGVSPFFPTPVLRSTSPTKLVEYFALGLPVVANDHPEQRLVLRQSRGGICVPWGARHFAKALRRLVLAGPACRQVLGERGRRWVLSNRTYGHIADVVSVVYQRAWAVG